MSLIRRLRRLWELSGTLSDAEDERMAESIKQEADFYRKSESKKRARKGQKLATILASSDPFEEFPSEDPEHDTTDKQPSDS